MKKNESYRVSVLPLLPRFPSWLSGKDAESAIILTTRLRFARNLHGEHFPHRQDKTERQRTLEKVHSALKSFSDKATFVSLDNLTSLETNLLVERRLISPQMAQDPLPRGVFIWKRQDTSLMICEEDIKPLK